MFFFSSYFIEIDSFSLFDYDYQINDQESVKAIILNIFISKT